ncbi:MAG: hypothetical protein H6807_10170 [Planctomycetes bacterium]|nr:hypothetical protein [Planctomycetota bacterium]
MPALIRSIVPIVVLTVQLAAQNVLAVPSASYPTIQSAILAAQPMDQLVVAAGTYFESLTIGDKSIVIDGAVGSDGKPATIIDGFGVDRCLAITAASPQAHPVLLFRNLAFRNGAPPLGDPLGHPERGGGVLIAAGSSTVNFIDCEFSGCEAIQGAAIFDAPESGSLLPSSLGLEGCHLHDNRWSSTPATPLSRRGGALSVSGLLELDGCVLERNGGALFPGQPPVGLGGALYIEESNGQAPVLSVSECSFLDNAADRGGAIFSHNGSPWILFSLHTFDRVRLVGNQAGSSGGALAAVGSGGLECDLCLVAGNDAAVGVTALDVELHHVRLDRCTIAGNGLGGGSGPVLRFALATPAQIQPGHPHLEFDRVILGGNGHDDWIIETTAGPPAPLIARSLLGLEATTHDPVTLLPGSASRAGFSEVLVGLDPDFIDPAADDFHLQGRSPAVDIAAAPGSFTPPPILLDLDLAAAPLGDGLDAGCFEHQAPDPGPDYDGNVPDGGGGSTPVLFCNGSAGGVAHRVWLERSLPYTIDVTPAPGDLAADFVVFGRLGQPDAIESFAIPFAQGSMAFAPAVVAPQEPALFVAFDSTLAIPALLATPPAPFQYAGTSLPVSAVVTLQALLTVSPADVRISNVLVLLSI